jgi:hypothetical protein
LNRVGLSDFCERRKSVENRESTAVCRSASASAGLDSPTLLRSFDIEAARACPDRSLSSRRVTR